MYYANTVNNSSGIPRQGLIEHLHGVMIGSLYFAKRLGVDDESLLEIISLSAFLHDVGKVSDYFQNETLGLNPSKTSINYPCHQEISWLYAAAHNNNKLFERLGLQSIYWHHATNFYQNELEKRNAQNVINELPEGELKIIYERINNLINNFKFDFDISKYIDTSSCDDDVDNSIPKLFEYNANNKQLNAQRLIVRSCLIASDHLVSSLSNEELNDVINSNDISKYYDNSRTFNKSYKIPECYDKNRFDTQVEIVNSCDRVTQVNAPAGFGKTVIGLLWGLDKNDQIYWVCPRNIVAEGVYENVVREIKNFGLNLSVELFLTSERKLCTNQDIEDCKSDIVVTNIDNLLSPMTNNQTGRIFDINSSNIVFDEFHEFQSEEALFSLFVILMNARMHLAKNTNTLLLSATPSVIHKLWDGNVKTKILPERGKHYPAQHNKLYEFDFSNNYDMPPKNSELRMFSSIKNVQEQFKNDYNIIIHSKYLPKDRENIMNNIINTFGKGGDKNGKVISAPILQAALDVSFNSLIKTCESPECDIQAIGRINRWGENNYAKVVFLDLDNKNNEEFNSRERGAIITRYNYPLSKKWNEFLKQKISLPITLNELYELYGEFINNNIELDNYLKKCFTESVKKLETFFPRKKPKLNNQKNNNTKISTKSLRSVTSSCFIAVKYSNGDWCPEPIPCSSADISNYKISNRKYIENEKIKTILENLIKVGYEYEDIVKKYFGKKKNIIKIKNKKTTSSKRSNKILTFEEFEKIGKCSDTPIPIFTSEYNTILGLIDKE